MNILEVLRNIASILVPSRPTLNVKLKDGRKFSYRIDIDTPETLVQRLRNDGFTESEIQEMMQVLAEIRKTQGVRRCTLTIFLG